MCTTSVKTSAARSSRIPIVSSSVLGDGVWIRGKGISSNVEIRDAGIRAADRVNLGLLQCLNGYEQTMVSFTRDANLVVELAETLHVHHLHVGSVGLVIAAGLVFALDLIQSFGVGFQDAVILGVELGDAGLVTFTLLLDGGELIFESEDVAIGTLLSFLDLSAKLLVRFTLGLKGGFCGVIEGGVV